MKKFFLLAATLVLTSGASALAQAQQQEEPARSPRLIVHLLDYLAKDYGGAVSGGKVISQSEYSEQVEFAETALKTASECPETKGEARIKASLDDLFNLIKGKADPEAVAKLAREIQAAVIQTAKIDQSPVEWPSLAHGKTLFAQNCAVCHGDGGAGDGPGGKGLEPAPANFLSADIGSVRTPFQSFNTIRLGVQGTGMPAFNALSDKEAWDLTFYVSSLRHPKPGDARNLPSKSAELLKKAASTSDSDLEKAGLAAGLIRFLSNDDDSSGGGSSLEVARADLTAALKAYESGDRAKAKTLALKAYLEGIEPVEPRLKATSAAVVVELETKMGAVREAIEKGAPPAALAGKIELALDEIKEAGALLAAKSLSPGVSFVATFSIIMREGFEAVLIILVLLGVVRAAQSRRAAFWVHAGWSSALGVGVIAWFLSGLLLAITGVQRELMEGGIALFAVAVLLYVGFWLHSQTEIGKWRAFIDGKVKRAVEGNRMYGLAAISFVAVFREAFETVLFLRAIWLEGGEGSKGAMLAGVTSSLALIFFLAWLLLRYSARLPIRKLFSISSAVMTALSLVLTGKGIHALQETGLVSVNSTVLGIHFELLGLYPTLETMAAQLVVSGVVIVLWVLGRKPATQPSAAAEA